MGLKLRRWIAVGYDSYNLGEVVASTKKEAERKARQRWGAILCYVESTFQIISFGMEAITPRKAAKLLGRGEDELPPDLPCPSTN